MTFQVSTGPIAITASTTKTLIDLAMPALGVARIYKWWVASDATSAGTATSALRVQIGRFTAAVTTHTSYTPDTFDNADAGTSSAVTAGINTTVEGAGTPASNNYEEHPLPLTQSELIVWEPTPRVVTSSTFWRMRLIVPANIGTTNIYAGVAWTE
jgi:hypothetical protein